MLGANRLLIFTNPLEVAEMEKRGKEIPASPKFEAAMAEVHGNQSGAALKSILNASYAGGAQGPDKATQRDYILLREDLIQVLNWV